MRNKREVIRLLEVARSAIVEASVEASPVDAEEMEEDASLHIYLGNAMYDIDSALKECRQ